MRNPRKYYGRRRPDRDANVQERKAGRTAYTYRPQRIGKDQAQGHHH